MSWLLDHFVWQCVVVPRTLRQVTGRSEDKTVQDVEVSASLEKLFTALLKNDPIKRDVVRLLHNSGQLVYTPNNSKTQTEPTRVMLDTLGFCIERGPSSVPLAGTGVFVTRGSVRKGVTVAMYPGIYLVKVTNWKIEMYRFSELKTASLYRPHGWLICGLGCFMI